LLDSLLQERWKHKRLLRRDRLINKLGTSQKSVSIVIVAKQKVY